MKYHFQKKQSGAALILIAFILGLGVSAYLIKAMNAVSLVQQQDEKTFRSLAEAKAALISWAVSHPNLPGLMPYPDRSTDGNYDDTSDCYATNVSFASNFVLGRLPLFKSDPNCVNGAIATITNGLSGDFRDGVGERLWYEVSRNLLYDYKAPGTAPIINPGIANNPTNAWMTVRDRNGVVLSNRVAAVIISPGLAIGFQDRSGGVATANQYLDKVVMADGTPYQNYGYQDPATNPVQEFIIGDDYKTVSKLDPTYKNQSIEPYFFNDKLVYITIDELMEALQRRVGEQVKQSLKVYKDNVGVYPYASPMGAPSNQKLCFNGNFSGALPTATQATNTCSYSASGTNASISGCGFNKVKSISYERLTSSFTAAQTVGACELTDSSTGARRLCTCTGAGSCSNTSGTQKFSCDASGSCNSIGVANGIFGIEGGVFSSITSQCAQLDPGCGSSRVSCQGVGSGNLTYTMCGDVAFDSGTSQLPSWFTVNAWQDYVYYQITRPADSNGLQAGSKKAAAVVITVGSPITSAPYSVKGSSQLSPSCSLTDYMDSPENTNGDSVFEAVNKIKTPNYNDQIFMVNP